MLEIKKTPQYLSPSSLFMFEDQPNKFYCQRMAPDPMPYEPQGIAAGVGSAFDAFIKVDWLKTRSGLSEEVRNTVINDTYDKEKKKIYQSYPIDKLLFESSVEEHNRDEALVAGRQLLSIYKINGYKPDILIDVEKHIKYNLCGKDIIIPLFMKLDAICVDSETGKFCPFDWKVKGYGSKSGASPTAGYYAMYDNMENKGAHKKYYKDIKAEEINIKYATQLCVYGWGMGKPVGEPFHGFIEELVIRPNKTRVAKYRFLISEDFQLQVKDRFETAWKAITDRSFIASLGRNRDLVSVQAYNESWF